MVYSGYLSLGGENLAPCVPRMRAWKPTCNGQSSCRCRKSCCCGVGGHGRSLRSRFQPGRSSLRLKFWAVNSLGVFGGTRMTPPGRVCLIGSGTPGATVEAAAADMPTAPRQHAKRAPTSDLSREENDAYAASSLLVRAPTALSIRFWLHHCTGCARSDSAPSGPGERPLREVPRSLRQRPERPSADAQVHGPAQRGRRHLHEGSGGARAARTLLA